MNAEGIPQARGRHALVQDREIHRVKRCIAQTSQHRHRHERRIALGHRSQKTGQGEQHQRAEQDRTGAQAVHHKACRRLAHTRDHKKQSAE